ncbi:MAG: hypothetical protein ABI318_05760, partial [Chthoniobacteraceae bacterium]
MSHEHVTTTLRWTGDWPWFASAGVALLLGVIAWLLYRRDTCAHNRWLRICLPSLRALAVVLIVLMLSGPVLHHRKVIGQLARLFLCIDASESMQLTDPAMDAGRKIAIARRLGLLEGAAVPLDLPSAAAALADARGIADRLPPPEALSEDVWHRLSSEFAAKAAEAVTLLAKAAPGSDDLARLRAEVAEPARELARRQFTGTEDQVRAANDLTRLGETAGRLSLKVSALFEKQIEADPAAAPLREALAKFDSLPRWQRVQALLLEGPPEKRILARLAEKHDVQLVLLDGNDVKPLWHSSAGDSAPPTGLQKPVAPLTNLTVGLKFAAEAAGGAEKSAVVLLTDGQYNSGESPLDAARILAGRKTAVFSVGFGSQVPPRDIAVLRVVAPDSVFFEDRVRGEIYIKEEIPPGEPFTVSVKDGGKVVWEKPLVSIGKGVRRVPFEFPIKDIAEARMKQQPQGYEIAGAPLQLTAEVSAVEGDRELSNNSAPLRFRAVTQKRKILILDGRPRWETRYLRNLFERDEKWEVNAVVAGATSDAGFLRGDKAGTFPASRKALDAYDLVIFGEVPRGVLRDEELGWLADFVGKRGGAIVFIDGQRGLLRGYAGTPLAPLFPVEWTGPGVRDGIKSLVLAGRAQTIGAFMLGTDSSVNADTWAKLPAPHFVAQVKPLPGAEVLLEANAATRMPAAVLRPFGAGRVYYQAFDDSWRWRYEVADLYHVSFWNQLADYIGEAPFAARDKFVQLDAGQLTYQPGEQADIRARLRDAEGRPVSDASVNAVLYRDGQKVATITLTPDEGGLYRGRTAALDSGSYEIAVDTAAVPAEQLKARTQFTVIPRENVERTLLSLNEDLLRQVSLAGGGEYLREEQGDALVEKLAPLSSGQVIESDTVLWQSWWWFIPIVLLLTLEWILRKR